MESKENNSIKLNDIKRQIEYYLSDINLQKDGFFHEKISSDPNGYIYIDLFLNCNKVIKEKWSIDDLINGIKLSNELEIDVSNKRVRRKDNKPLPELKLLSKKRKEKKDKCDIDPIVLIVISKDDINITSKMLLDKFKTENPDLNVIYARYEGREGHLVILPKENDNNPVSFKETLSIEDVDITIEKCTSNKLIEFWKNYSEHYENCINSLKAQKLVIKKYNPILDKHNTKKTTMTK